MSEVKLCRYDPNAWYWKKDLAETYESYYEGKYKRADVFEKGLLLRLTREMGQVGRVLEVGAGTSHFTRWLESLGVKIVGLDVSPAMLGVARMLWQGDLIRADSAYLPIRDNSFDIVAFITCFEYMPFPTRTLREAARVARKGVMMGIMNKHSLPTLRRMLQIKFGRNPYYRNAHFYSIWELKSFFKKAFRDRGYQLVWWTTVYPRFLPLKNTKLPFGAFLGVAIVFREATPAPEPLEEVKVEVRVR